jgi:4-aminobutyrate--pyruvate transaminase
MTDRGNSAAARDIANIIHPFTNLLKHRTKGPLILDHGKGIYVYDDEGREYIEGLAGLWCTGLGFGDEELVEVAAAQMRKLPYYHSFAHRSHGPAIELSEKLKELAPASFSKVFFTNSGSEANDTLVKLIWYYNNAVGRPRKKKIVSRLRAYHGVTVAAASLTGLPILHASFDLPIPQVVHTTCPDPYRGIEPGESESAFADRLAADLDALIQREGPDTVAAFIAEPIMGAGGVVVPPETYFEKMQAVCTRYDVLMVADEVICGFGRTGNVWGSQTFGIEPDFLTCAKQLSSGYLPIAALMIPEAVFEAMAAESEKIGTFGHGYTYSGHPVSAAVALRTLQLYEERGIYDNVRKVGPRFEARLKALADHPLVGHARGVGLIGALELVADKATKRPFDPKKGVGPYAVDRAEAHGLLSRAVGGDNVALCPPMIVTEAEVDEIFDRLTTALDETEAWVAKQGLRQEAA